ncbi:MAG: YeeE/YedE family protein [Sandaracinaceae bacterium]
MKRETLNALVALAAGTLFGAGLVIGGMTMPSKVRGFLDFTGDWDPTLIFVMGGAVAVHATVWLLVKGRASPLLAERFALPTRRDIDAKLVLGAAIFGLGWGFGGFCPGPAITSLPSAAPSVIAFVVAMLAASWITGELEARAGTRPASPSRQPQPAPRLDATKSS